MDHDIFKAFCLRVSVEKDPKIIEMLKQRLLSLLSLESEFRARKPSVSTPVPRPKSYRAPTE
jgi:hypothetical protein